MALEDSYLFIQFALLQRSEAYLYIISELPGPGLRSVYDKR